MRFYDLGRTFANSLTHYFLFSFQCLDVSLYGRSDVRLVVIDSMAAQFRTEFAVEETTDRSNTIFGFARQLKMLADEHSLVMLAINQVGWLGGRVQRCLFCSLNFHHT